jgi:hypothetical protein
MNDMHVLSLDSLKDQMKKKSGSEVDRVMKRRSMTMTMTRRRRRKKERILLFPF